MDIPRRDSAAAVLHRLSRLVREPMARAILTNSGSLVASMGVTMSLGFVYWFAAARLFPVSVVGVAAALISSMTVLATLGALGLTTVVVSELPVHRGQETRLIATALALAGAVGAVLGIGFAVVAPLMSSTFRPLGQGPAALAVFALGVAATGMAVVFDPAMIALMRGGVQMTRNVAFAVAKIVALLATVALWPVHAPSAGLAIYAGWSLATVLSFGVVVGQAPLRKVAHAVRHPSLSIARHVGRTVVSHQALNFAVQLPGMALPLAVTIIVSTTANAYFYVAWMLAIGFAFVFPWSLANVLFAAGARAPEEFPRAARITLGISVLIGILSNLAVLIAGHSILRLFGAAYAEHSTTSLRILTLGVFALAIKDHYVVASRVRRQLVRCTAIVSVAALIEIVVAAAAAFVWGVPGLCAGYVAVLSLEGVAIGPAVYRMIFSPAAARVFSAIALDQAGDAQVRLNRLQDDPTGDGHLGRIFREP